MPVSFPITTTTRGPISRTSGAGAVSRPSRPWFALRKTWSKSDWSASASAPCGPLKSAPKSFTGATCWKPACKACCNASTSTRRSHAIEEGLDAVRGDEGHGNPAIKQGQRDDDDPHFLGSDALPGNQCRPDCGCGAQRDQQPFRPAPAAPDGVEQRQFEGNLKDVDDAGV